MTRAHQIPVLVEPVQGQVPQAGVLRDSDPVLTPGAAAVAQLEVGQLSPFRTNGVGANAVSWYPSTSSNRSSRPRVGPFAARDDPHPDRPPLQVAVGGQDMGEVDDAGSLTDVAVGIDHGLPRLLGHPLVQRGVLPGRVNPIWGCPL